MTTFIITMQTSHSPVRGRWSGTGVRTGVPGEGLWYDEVWRAKRRWDGSDHQRNKRRMHPRSWRASATVPATHTQTCHCL